MNIFITLDYELFLGDNTGTPENCLIHPMNALCSVIEKHNVKLIIFVDAAYLLRMFQLKDKYIQVKNDFALVCNHIKKLKLEGHDIQFHFHPQWMYSNWNDKDNKWTLDFAYYKLSDMDTDFAFHSFAEAKKLLDSIIDEKTYAFRAGGYSLETFTDYINLFELNGIIIDSSVYRGVKVKSKFQEYDYRSMPKKTIYKFKNNFKVEDKRGRFQELSIYSCKWNPIYFYSFIRPKLFDYYPEKIYKDGVGVSVKKNISFLQKVRKIFKLKIFQASIDGRNSNIIDLVYKNACSNSIKDLVFIGHPKNFSDKSIRNLVDFIKRTENNNNYLTTKDLL